MVVKKITHFKNVKFESILNKVLAHVFLKNIITFYDKNI